MAAELFEERHIELSADASHVGSAWVVAAVAVLLLMTIVAPMVIA